ncbi:hypothetical protein [Sulfuricella denitrificans]|nr:hypothetical protein [Sulfuricella denitrificans]
MKKIALCLVLASLYGTSHASSLSIESLSAEFAVNNYDGQPKEVTGAKKAGNFGILMASGAGTFTATYLGNESSYLDGFRFVLEGKELNEANVLGKSISKQVTGGVVGFQFFDSKGAVFNNGEVSGAALGFAFLKDRSGSSFAESNKYGTFQYLLGFNDSYKGDADYDDYVVGVNFVSTAVMPLPVTAVPLPAALPLLASAVGMLGVVMRRRKVALADA